jgi:hypothetical protein
LLLLLLLLLLLITGTEEDLLGKVCNLAIGLMEFDFGNGAYLKV